MFTYFIVFSYFEALINISNFHFMQLLEMSLYIIVQYYCMTEGIAPKRIENRVVRFEDELENSITDICTM